MFPVSLSPKVPSHFIVGNWEATLPAQPLQRPGETVLLLAGALSEFGPHRDRWALMEHRISDSSAGILSHPQLSLSCLVTMRAYLKGHTSSLCQSNPDLAVTALGREVSVWGGWWLARDRTYAGEASSCHLRTRAWCTKFLMRPLSPTTWGPKSTKTKCFLSFHWLKSVTGMASNQHGMKSCTRLWIQGAIVHGGHL